MSRRRQGATAALPQQGGLTPAQHRTIRKLIQRLVPFMGLCYFVAYLDRVNVGFAALTMNKSLGITPEVFGWDAGIFFIGYFLFEVPSNVAFEKFGARLWIGRIMISWGIVSACIAFVWNDASFLVARFLLGIAEAGFFPGIILYLTYWFPQQYRARVIGLFMLSVPVSTVIGAPVSGAILNLDGVVGLQGWQWLFILEGIPSVLLGFAVLFLLRNGPTDAPWLDPDERDWLVHELESERTARRVKHSYTLWKALADPGVLALGFIYFGVVAAPYGLGFWLPQIVKAFGLTNVQTGFVTAIPYAIGATAMALVGVSSDRFGEARWHAGAAALTAAAGIIGSTALENPVLKMAALSIAAIGIFGFLPVFWTLPSEFLTGTAAAAGIALINSIGNLAGFAGPVAMGYIKGATGSFSLGLVFIGLLAVMSSILIFALGFNRSHQRAKRQTVLTCGTVHARHRMSGKPDILLGIRLRRICCVRLRPIRSSSPVG
jgi:ACS family tartrate transporter-like MFS transporter